MHYNSIAASPVNGYVSCLVLVYIVAMVGSSIQSVTCHERQSADLLVQPPDILKRLLEHDVQAFYKTYKSY